MSARIFCLIMLYLNAKGKVDGPYPFFRVRNQTVLATVLWMVVLMLAMTAISGGVMLVTR